MSATAEPDLVLGGRLRLHQPPRGSHRAGTDAVLLATLFRPRPGSVILDLGASSGLVGLACALRAPESRVVLVEREPALADLARRNIAENGLEDRVEVREADILAPAAVRREAGLVPDSADVVLTNPPFLEAGRHRPSPRDGKASAHSFEAGALEAWLRTCADVARPGGRLGLIHRADALPACLDALGNRFGSLRVRPVHARAERPAIRVLVAGTMGSRGPFRLLPPLVLEEADGRFTPENAALHRGEGAAMEMGEDQ
ncbi:tRNA1(Val) (adenine(37)-N6)-methyltransferase [Methylobacterium oxalidis]|uniref:Methyltransferase n=1 Tax=Methylobacterium oxalidis TaxID=944322 RepID=A0A512J711_9HYPH|nr:methyltransferase [Methylobacterium oxalidis]GEP05761.1 methyltransferase [Methylobacterium oxalidis]GJE35823.1 tRNA1(Val) (adenine(37)-N6)-methyltransferase [Methylobacterium oxalidis]GLS62656.1 methyltransferase [Methylobacterium oxalidis]